MKKYSRFSILILGACNLLLILASWVMMIYAYPRLPREIPLWLNLVGQPVYRFPRSPVIFLYPLVQTAGALIFWLLGFSWAKKPEESRECTGRAGDSAEKISERTVTFLKKEILLLALVFYNLIFIHLERSLIWLAHGLAAGVNKFYFFGLIIFLLLIIPYYRLRLSIAGRLKSLDRLH